jgi:hypothetical protein
VQPAVVPETFDGWNKLSWRLRKPKLAFRPTADLLRVGRKVRPWPASFDLAAGRIFPQSRRFVIARLEPAIHLLVK